MSDWSVIESVPDVESITSDLSDHIIETEDEFVGVASWSVHSIHTSGENTASLSEEDDIRSDTFSWISSQKSQSKDEHFANAMNVPMDSSYSSDASQPTYKFMPVVMVAPPLSSSAANRASLVNGKSVLKLGRPKPRSKRDYMRRRNHLSRLSTIAETKKAALKQKEVAKLKKHPGAIIHIEDIGGVSTMQDVDDAFSLLLFDKNKTSDTYVVDLCNYVAQHGRVKTLDGIDISLYESTFVAERLRDIIFDRLFQDCFTEWNARNNWVGLHHKARIMMTPVTSIDHFRRAFAVHHTVPIAALLRVPDMHSFSLLSRDEWVRVATFGSYCSSVEARDRKLLNTIVEHSAFVKLPFLTVERVREMVKRLDLAVTEDDIQSSFSEFSSSVV